MGTVAFTTTLGINAVTVLGVLLPNSANAAAPRHTLSVKTCEHQYSETWDTLHISFCAGPSNCTMGRKNAYNGDRTALNIPGTWSVLKVPLEYEPTTMLIENEGGIDAWCAEDIVFNKFRIFDEDSSPPIRLSKASPERYFYNLQAQDLDAGKTSTSNEEGTDFLEELSWTVCAEIIAALGSGLLLYGFVGGTSFFRRWASWGRRRTDHESEGSSDDVHICRVCKERAVARNEASFRRVERLREVEQPLQHRLSTLWMSRGQMEDADDDTGEMFRKDEEGTKQDASVLHHLRRWPSIDSSHSSCQRLLRRTSYQNSLEEGGGTTPQLVSSDEVEGQKVL